MVNWWRCLAQAENVLVEMEEQTKRMGLYTPLFVEAEDAVTAKVRAADTLKSRLQENGMDLTQATFHVDEIEQVLQEDVPETPIGFAWYSMEE